MTTSFIESERLEASCLDTTSCSPRVVFLSSVIHNTHHARCERRAQPFIMTSTDTASSVAARKRVLSGSLDQAPPHPSAPLNRQSVDMSNGQKRTRTVAPMLDLGTSAESQVTSVALSTPPASSSHASSQAIPDAALLYYLAVRAHHSAHLHLQQVFVPHRIRTDAEPGTAIPLNSNPTMSTAFEHDYQATDKALALLVMALDYLKLGLASRSLSDRERVAFGVEFAQVGLKVLRTLKTGRDEQRRSSKGKERSLEERVDAAGLSADLHDILSTTVGPAALGFARSAEREQLCVAEGQDYLSEYRKKLETCNVQLAFADVRIVLESRRLLMAEEQKQDGSSPSSTSSGAQLRRSFASVDTDLAPPRMW